MRSVNQFFMSTGEGDNFTPLTDNAFDAFGFLNLYNIQIDSFLLFRGLGSNITPPWQGEFPKESDIDTFISIDPLANYHAEYLYPQKNTISQIALIRDSSASNTFNHDLFGNKKHGVTFNNLSSSYYKIIGTLRSSLSKNVPYFAVTILVKGNTIKAGLQPLFYISTGANAGRNRVGVYLNANPSLGVTVVGRRATADAATTISSSHDASNWTVITAIFDYNNQDLILRINGIQTAINTSFGSGANSENTDSLASNVGGPASTFSMAALCIWNTNPSSISEIEAVENRYMTYVGI